jgi:hypothetical protein
MDASFPPWQRPENFRRKTTIALPQASLAAPFFPEHRCIPLSEPDPSFFSFQKQNAL